jgi:DNA-binding transcriptional ArsR family regulator
MRQIVAISPDGRHKFYRSITEFREDYKVSPPTIDRALKKGVPITRGKLKGWRFEYYDPKKEVLDTSFKQA